MLENRSRPYEFEFEERRSYTDSLWKEFVGGRTYKIMEGIFSPALELYHDALVCFDRGTNLSAVVTCRIALEGALYIATANEGIKIKVVDMPRGDTYVQHSWNSSKCSRFLMEQTLEGLKKEAEEQNIIGTESKKIINLIQAKGNVAAHHIQKLNKHHQRWIPKRAGEVGIDDAIRETGAKYQFDISETKRILEGTKAVILDLMAGVEKVKVVDREEV